LTVTLNNGINIAVIGTRDPSSHGINAAERLGERFSLMGCAVVSGLALGCDTYAHRGCLKANGKAIAILPGGIDKIYPSSNTGLAEDILRNSGLLLSEYSPGTRPFKTNYIDRDRLQSGISDAVVVVETDIKGGTMHTVGFAAKQSRQVVAYIRTDPSADVQTMRGNVYLVNSNIAAPLKNDEDIKSIVNRARASTESIRRPTSIQKEEQLMFFDLIGE
jgi:DNA processing protein